MKNNEHGHGPLLGINMIMASQERNKQYGSLMMDNLMWRTSLVV